METKQASASSSLSSSSSAAAAAAAAASKHSSATSSQRQGSRLKLLDLDSQPVLGRLVEKPGLWRLRLLNETFRFERMPDANGDSFEFDFGEVAGVEFIGDGGPVNHYLCLRRYPRSKKGHRKRKMTLFQLLGDRRPETKVQLKASLFVAMRSVIIGRRCAMWPSRPLLVLVNPASGSGAAMSMFRKVARPLLRQAEMPHRLLLTEGPGHARRLMAEDGSLYAYSAVVICGGDGLVHEAINGLLLDRRDWRTAAKRVAFGVIPAGSGNGLAASLAHDNGDCITKGLTLTSTFNLVKGAPRLVDLAVVELQNRETRVAMLSVSYGLLAEIDIGSERFKALGSARFDLTAVMKITAPSLPSYRATLAYLPCDDDQPDPVVELGEADGTEEGDCLASLKRHAPASLNDPTPDDWLTVDGEFLFVQASLQSHIAADNRMTPMARPQDGRFQICWIRPSCGRARLLAMLGKVETGGHADYDEFHCVQAKAFRLEPQDHAQVTIDGEAVQFGCVQAEVMPGLGRILAPNWHGR